MTNSMYFQITSLLNSGDEKQTQIGQDIKNNVLFYSQTGQVDKISYDSQIWGMFAKADMTKDNGIEFQKSDTPQAVSNLPAIRTNNSLLQRIMGIFNRKSEIDRITDEVVTDDRIYEAVCKAIQDRVKGEDARARGIEEYYRSADRRLPVFDFLRSIDIEKGKDRKPVSFDYRIASEIDRDETYIRHEISDVAFINRVNYRIDSDMRENASNIGIECKKHANLIDLYHFSNFLGESTGSSFRKRIAEYLSKYFIDYLEYNKIYQDELIADLSKRLKRAMKEYRKQKKSFFMAEEEKIREATSENKRRAFAEGVAVDITPTAPEHYKDIEQGMSKALPEREDEQK